MLKVIVEAVKEEPICIFVCEEFDIYSEEDPDLEVGESDKAAIDWFINKMDSLDES